VEHPIESVLADDRTAVLAVAAKANHNSKIAEEDGWGGEDKTTPVGKTGVVGDSAPGGSSRIGSVVAGGATIEVECDGRK
jgi:hypothetical protein